MSRVLRVIHEIHHTFRLEQSDVAAVLRLCPLDGGRQRVLHHEETASPHATLRLAGEDEHGNTITEALWESLSELTVRAASAVELTASGDRLRHVAPERFFEPTLKTPITTELAAMGRRIFRDRPIDAGSLFSFAKSMRSALRYDERWERVRRSATAALRDGEGAHADYAHVAVAVLRSMGHAACYVSGYLFPPSGAGAAREHAWIGIFTESHGWLEVDPMLGCPPDLRHLAIAVGLDRQDCLPFESRAVSRGLHRVRSKLTFYPLTRTPIPCAGPPRMLAS